MNTLLSSLSQKLKTTTILDNSNDFNQKIPNLSIYLGLLAAWMVIVITASFQHELWRDEVRAFSIAIGVDSPFKLLSALKDEGHPGLWHLLLYIGYSLTHSVYILQSIALSIAFLLVALFLFRSPFPLWVKVMFVFSIFPVYEYSVMARNYGISMLLFFIFACAYKERQKHPWLLGLILGLLANTNAHSLILSGILAAVWLWDEFENCNYSPTQLFSHCRLGMVAAAAGALLAVITILPEHSTIQSPVKHNFHEIASSVILNSIFPGKKYLAILPISHQSLINTLMVWGLAAGLAKRIPYSIALIAGYTLIGVFAELVYVVALRHQGVVFSFTLCLYWIAQQNHSETDPRQGTIETVKNAMRIVALCVILPTILAFQVHKGYKAIALDMRELKSSSASLGQFLSSHPELHDAIIMGEPEYLIEALPYYAKNRIYLPRQSEFGTVFRWTSARKEKFSLGELLQSANKVKEQYQVPVLIALGVGVLEGTQVDIPTKTGLKLSSEELAEFSASTQQLVRFDAAIGDENFIIYQLK
jgi:hypothetical protein